ncbi:MAG: flagellar brake protein [Lachnospiraceae bacterium]|nr:flagellar brake protein [Lachnospiraceae bacterium]
MLSKFITLGDRIELTAVGRVKLSDEEERRTYQSKVYEILTDDTLEITMPMEKTKLILLPVDGEYDVVFYTDTGLYQCFVRIADRYKSNNVYILRVELTSNLRKYQRREYYRFSCALEMCSRNLEEDEQQAIEERKPYILQPGLPLKKSVIVDISGGGLRFMSTQKYEPGSLLYCSYHLVKNGVSKQYEVIGKVLSVNPIENRPGTYEHRVQYYNMDTATREEIIRFIFEEERRNRQKKS